MQLVFYVLAHLLASNSANGEAVVQVEAPLITDSILGPHTLHIQATLSAEPQTFPAAAVPKCE